MLILEHDLTICLKINPFIKEVFGNAAALRCKLCLEYIKIRLAAYMYGKAASVDDRNIIVCIIRKRLDDCDLAVAYLYRYLITEYDNIEAVRIPVRLALYWNLVADRVGLAGWLYLKYGHTLEVIVELLEDISVGFQVAGYECTFDILALIELRILHNTARGSHVRDTVDQDQLAECLMG